MIPKSPLAEAAAVVRVVPHDLSAALPDGEAVILSIKPAMMFIPLAIAGRLAAVGLLTLLVVWLAMRGATWPMVGGVIAGTEPLRVLLAGFAVILAMLIWQRLEWNARQYLLTDRRVAAAQGVIRQYRVEVPLARVQHVVMYRSLRERLFGLGTIGVASAGTDAIEVVWFIVARPHEVLETIRKTIDRYAHGERASGDRGERRCVTDSAAEESGVPSKRASEPSSKPCLRSVPLIGLAGGIGAGKSTAAAAFRELGCLILDSDAEAKAALDRPDVRSTLVAWWGEGILSAPNERGERRVDRSKVAAIVFGDPEQRRRLESLVHPILRRDREAMLGELDSRPDRRAGVRAVILDAPLLFEAGLDGECDAVVFVDAPREQRLARVAATRGWSEQELSRREANQLPVEEKRKRSQVHLTNTGEIADLKKQAEAALATVLKLCGRPD